MFITKISNSLDEVIFSNSDEGCTKCCSTCNSISEVVQTCSFFKNKRRRGSLIIEGVGSIYLCTEEDAYIKSARLFKEKMSVYEVVLKEILLIKETITDVVNKDTKRLIHNLTSLNAHNIQELYNLVPQDILTQDYREQINIIIETVESNLKKTAKCSFVLLRIMQQ